jgi:mono/diheme cytochrome c family protein/glucose/arabinose dehydrogenase
MLRRMRCCAPSACSLGFAALLCLLGTRLSAQQGDRAGEQQAMLPADFIVPPALVRSPAEELATLQLAPGFRAELFAAEPLVADPVAAAFDADGRLWVVEMRSYMRDVDATDEARADGRIVVLHDDDHDGRADRSVPFAEGLVLPRAVLPLHGGALVVSPPQVLWCPDADGDGVADARIAVLGGFESGLANPEHCGNGLCWSFDHRIRLANDPRLLQRHGERFDVVPGAGGGQWGLSLDDCGRAFFNYNEDWLRVDLVPGRHAPAAAAVGDLPQLNWRVVAERTTWPVRVTPGVNRGYQQGRLVDGRLAIHTAACAPLVHRGSKLPGCDGDAFVCEPAGNLVRRIRLRDDGSGRLVGSNVYEAERREFLASTDERFRPVHLVDGPDGALWLVDMYRGVIQHRNFVTTFLRRQIEDRGLASPIGLGRIWRIVPDGATLPMRPLRLAAADDATLLAALCHDEGAVRDLALRTLVQQERHSLLPGLREQLRTAPRPALRIAALSALVGLEQLSTEDLRAALRDDDAGVLAFAVEHAGPRLAVGDAMVWLRCEHLAGSAPLPVAWHLALVLGDVLRAPGGCTARRREAALALLARLLRRADTDAGLVAAVATGAGPGELPALLRLFVATAPTLADATLTELVRRAALAREPATIEALLATAGAAAPAQCLAVLQGVRAALPAAPRRIGSLPLAEQELLRAWAGGTDELATVARDLLAAAKLRSEQVAVPTVRSEHSPEQRRLIEQGAGVYARVCAGCHQPDGRGLAGLAPPLRDSEWVLGPVPVLARIVLHGVRGPIEVAGTSWSLEMPGQRQLADAEVAAVAAFLRNSFGHHAAPPTAAEIAAVRAATAGRSEPWTASELAGVR